MSLQWLWFSRRSPQTLVPATSLRISVSCQHGICVEMRSAQLFVSLALFKFNPLVCKNISNGKPNCSGLLTLTNSSLVTYTTRPASRADAKISLFVRSECSGLIWCSTDRSETLRKLGENQQKIEAEHMLVWPGQPVPQGTSSYSSGGVTLTRTNPTAPKVLHETVASSFLWAALVFAVRRLEYYPGNWLACRSLRALINKVCSDGQVLHVLRFGDNAWHQVEVRRASLPRIACFTLFAENITLDAAWAEVLNNPKKVWLTSEARADPTNIPVADYILFCLDPHVNKQFPNLAYHGRAVVAQLGHAFESKIQDMTEPLGEESATFKYFKTSGLSRASHLRPVMWQVQDHVRQRKAIWLSQVDCVFHRCVVSGTFGFVFIIRVLLFREPQRL